MPHFNNPAFFCITDGDHVYTLNMDLDRLAQKTSSDEYQLTARPNFYTPKKQAEKANYRAVALRSCGSWATMRRRTRCT